ncbi:MAG: hypothetical protein J6B91_03755 [Prevotella sp.]|nr:hypothetical protein [Prevotella sp.]
MKKEQRWWQQRSRYEYILSVRDYYILALREWLLLILFLRQCEKPD